MKKLIMLSINKLYLKAFLVLVTTTSLYSSGLYKVSNLYIGINLKDAKNIMPCLAETRVRKVGLKIVNTYLECNKKNHMIYANFDHNSKLYLFSKTKFFTVPPNWNKIKQQVIKRFGNTYIQEIRANSKCCKTIDYCWGDCKSRNRWDYLTADDKYEIRVSISKYKIRKEGHQDSISFDIYDKKMEEANWLFEKEEKNRRDKKIRERESDIDF